MNARQFANRQFANRLETWIACILLGFVSPVAAQQSQKKAIYNSEKEVGDPISAAEAVAVMELPEGFQASVFAAEPEVMNPIAATTDALGRVWVAENFTYAERQQRFDLELSDRVIVLEDTNGDGTADQRTVFRDDLKCLTGITVGRGGVWLMAPPQLIFVPDANADLVPDGPEQVILDGFHRPSENYHNFANGLSWGPDGWLYGRSGASGPGDMGLPGVTDDQRVPIRGGIWRYHPERRVVEALTQGTTNPWGHDWNEYGDLFFINTVNGHFWHCIPGAHFVRPHTLDLNPYSFELIDMHADHWHFDTGKSWTASRDGAANDYGGGHAHIGMLLYQEPTWPTRYHGQVMTVNMHGRRINVESLHRSGSGYVASHEKDFMLAGDAWFRGMELLPQPDGNVLLLDWSDTGECHEHTGVHRTSGRIYRIAYQGSKIANAAMVNPLRSREVRSSPIQLAKLQLTSSEWVARRSREKLTELRLFGADMGAASSYLQGLLKSNQPASIRLRGLWGLVAIDAVTPEVIDHLLQSDNENLRCWGVRLVVDHSYLDTAFGNRPANPGKSIADKDYQTLLRLAEVDQSAKVRLELASAIQRIELSRRGALAKALVAHANDAEDHNLPLMVWYGLIPLAEGHVDDLVQVAKACTWPTTRRLIARRLAIQSKQDSSGLEQLFAIGKDARLEWRRDLVLGTAEALAGWSRAAKPQAWDSIASSLEPQSKESPVLRDAIQGLNVLFGDGRTVAELMRVADDGKAELELRKAALRSLVDAKAQGTKDLCLRLLNTRFLNSVAAAGLSREEDPELGKALVDSYRRFHPSERGQLISVLCSRAPWAVALLKAVESGSIPREQLSAFQARQMASHEAEEVDALLAKVWGQVRASSAQRRQQIEEYRTKLTPELLALGDASAGRKLFAKTCGNCHTLFGVGGNLGPDLTGAQRTNLDYLLENIVDPSAVVTKEFRATIIRTEDDRVFNGLVTSEDESIVTLATQNETHKIEVDSIVARKKSAQSTMPEGLLDTLTDAQRRDLFAYLQSTQQVE